VRPIIGITTYVEPATWGVWRNVEAALVPYTYAQAVTAAGGRAVLLPPDDPDTDALRVLDGLVLSGGADLGAGLYGRADEPLTDSRPGRDAAELPLLRAALTDDVPVLGVCRGMQLLAIAAGGTLHQHLPDVLGHEKHRPAPGVYGSQSARFTPGSRIAALLGDAAEIHCYHHQGVAEPGSLVVTGRTDDGSPEVLEDPERRFVIGVQWHPEVGRDARIFAALVAAAGARRPSTPGRRGGNIVNG
jgi:putative glutamine amidotransferase